MPRLTCILPPSAQRTRVGITLPGLRPPSRIEGTLDREHLLALGRRELHAHRAELFDADAVLAGDGAAHRHAEFEDLGAEGFGALQLVGVVGVEQDQRMQVAVAGMEDVEAAQAVPCRHRADGDQHLGQAAARDRRIHAQVVGADAAARRKGVLAAAPEAQALRLVLAGGQPRRAGRLQHRRHARDLVLDLGRRAVALAEQDGGRVEVVAGMDEAPRRRPSSARPSSPGQRGRCRRR